MDNLYGIMRVAFRRFLYLCIGVGLGAWSVGVWADVVYNLQGMSGGADTSNSGQGSCNTLVGMNWYASDGSGVVSVSSSTFVGVDDGPAGSCTVVGTCMTMPDVQAPRTVQRCSPIPPCPGNQVWDDASGQCICPDGMQWNESTQLCEGECVKGANAGLYKDVYGGVGCSSSGCELSMANYGGGFAMCSGKKEDGGWDYCTMAETGDSCEAGGGGDPEGPEEPCGAGEYAGTVNGVTVCGPDPGGAAVTSTTVSSSRTAGDGTSSSSSTTTTTQTDANGAPVSVTTTTTNTNYDANGDPLTTETIVNTIENVDGIIQQTSDNTLQGGGGGGTTTTTETSQGPVQAWCEANPGSPICGTGGGGGGGGGDGDGDGSGGSFGGNCGAGFSCEGDAVECAIARETYVRNCQLFETSTALSDLGNAVANGEDPLAGEHPAQNPEEVDVAQAFESARGSRFLAESCIGPVSISIGLGSFTLPTEQICSMAEIVGNILVALAGLVAVRIVGRG